MGWYSLHRFVSCRWPGTLYACVLLLRTCLLTSSVNVDLATKKNICLVCIAEQVDMNWSGLVQVVTCLADRWCGYSSSVCSRNFNIAQFHVLFEELFRQRLFHWHPPFSLFFEVPKKTTLLRFDGFSRSSVPFAISSRWLRSTLVCSSVFIVCKSCSSAFNPSFSSLTSLFVCHSFSRIVSGVLLLSCFSLALSIPSIFNISLANDSFSSLSKYFYISLNIWAKNSFLVPP